MKPIKAWAVVNKYGRCVVSDSEVYVYSNRQVAVTRGRHILWPRSETVVRVEIREVQPKARQR